MSSFATRSRVCNSGSFFSVKRVSFIFCLGFSCCLYYWDVYYTGSLRKQPTFGDTSAGFPAKWCLTNSILMMRHYPDLGGASDWSCCMGNLIQPIRSTTQIWVVMHHQYLISVLLSLTKCLLISQKGYIIARCLQDKSWSCNKIINLEFSSKIFTKHRTVCILFMVGGGSLKLAHDFMLLIKKSHFNIFNNHFFLIYEQGLVKKRKASCRIEDCQWKCSKCW